MWDIKMYGEPFKCKLCMHQEFSIVFWIKEPHESVHE